MTADLLYRTDPYAREAEGTVLGHSDEGGVIVSPSLFYPKGGGQPGDSGWLEWDGRSLPIATAVAGPIATAVAGPIATAVAGAEGASVLVPAEPAPLPPKGAKVLQVLDWERRHRHMRVHTALHLLSVVVPLPVTGGNIGAHGGRLDFLMPEPPEDKDGLERALNRLVDRDYPVIESWISEADLDEMPELVKTLSVRPPRGAGTIRLVQIGEDAEQVDLQPCGGTHVARTSEVGALTIGKIENKGKQNRRVHVLLT